MLETGGSVVFGGGKFCVVVVESPISYLIRGSSVERWMKPKMSFCRMESVLAF